MRFSIRYYAAALAILVFLVSGCATPVGVKHVDEETAYRTLDANILSSGEPSAYSTQLLERNALVRRYRNDPEAVLAELYSGLGKPDERDRLFALAELSFAHVEAGGNRSYYLSSGVFAYAFLFPQNSTDAPESYDPRLRLAVDLYNQSLAHGLATKDGSEIDLSPGQLPLSFGTLDLQVDEQDFRYGGYHLTKFVSLSDLKVRGLRNRLPRCRMKRPLSSPLPRSEKSPRRKPASSKSRIGAPSKRYASAAVLSDSSGTVFDPTRTDGFSSPRLFVSTIHGWG